MSELMDEAEERMVWLTPFPVGVFVDDQPWLSKHLLPLFSIDLGNVRPDLAGTVVHMVCPVEPYDGYIGDSTEEHHNEFSAPNWFAFQLTEDCRYRFLGNEGYFSPPATPNEVEQVRLMLEAYEKAVSYYRKHGSLRRFSRYAADEGCESDWLDGVGEDIWAGNWSVGGRLPTAFNLVHDDDQDRVELTCQGNPCFLVAQVAAYYYGFERDDTILVFYEPKSRIVLFTFDWT